MSPDDVVGLEDWARRATGMALAVRRFDRREDDRRRLRCEVHASELRDHRFDRLAKRTGFGVAETRRRVADAVDRVVNEWNLLEDYLDGDAYRRLTARRDALAVVRRD